VGESNGLSKLSKVVEVRKTGRVRETGICEEREM